MGLKVLKNNRGSAYVFVTIIMFTVFLMLAIALSSSRYEAMAGVAYMKALGMYELSESGVYRGLQCIREVLSDEGEINSQNEAVAFIMNKLDLTGRTEYFEIIKYSINTIVREETPVEYITTIIMKAEPIGVGTPHFTIISSTKSTASTTVIKVKGNISLLYDESGAVYPHLDLLRQID